MDKILLIDGNSIANRAFYGLNVNSFKAPDGRYTNAVYGFLNIMFKVMDKINPKFLGVAFDLKKPTFRHEKYTEYKAGRHAMPEELKEQFPLLKEVISKMNIPIYEKEGFEADDILGTIAKNLNEELDVYLLTGDRDYFQLVDKNITVIMPKNGISEDEIIDIESIKEKFDGLLPKDLIEVKALMGDKSDNIPGIPGIGEKTAVKYILEFQNLENMYEKIESGKSNLSEKQKEKILSNKESAFLSRELGEILLNAPIEIDKEKLAIKEWDSSILKLFKQLAFNQYIKKFKLEENTKNVAEEKNEEFENIKYITLYNLDKYLVDEIYTKVSNEEKIYIYLKSTESTEYNIFDSNIKYMEIYLKSLNSIYRIELNNFHILDKNLVNEKVLEYELIKNIFENEKILKITYDIKNILILLYKINIFPKGIYNDIKIAEYIIDSSNGKYILENLIYKYLESTYLNCLQKEEKQISFFENDENTYSENKNISYIIYKIYLKQEKIIKEQNLEKVLYEIEMPLVLVLAKMTNEGIKVDKDILINFGKELEKNILEIQEKIYSYAEQEFNINSPKQVGEILFEKLKLPIVKKNKTGYSTDIDTLNKLINEHEIVEKIIEYRELSKLNSTYVNGLIPYILDDERIHGKFHQTVTATGRISSTDPNLQNIPTRKEIGKEIRKAFIPKEGYIFLDADYSQIELRILAHIADEPSMIQAFINNEDIHSSTASKIFNKDIKDVTSEDRRNAKAVNFGIIYGISKYGLSENVGMSIKESKEYIDKYLEKYAGIKQYMLDAQNSAKEKGYALTLYNRRRYIPELKSSNFNLKEFGKRVALNAPIQGTAADIMKLAMIKIDEEFTKRKLLSKLLIQVHDEVLIEMKKEEKEIVTKIVKDAMENVIQMKVPITIDSQIGENWFDVH